MRDGHVEQIGAPLDLYGFPDNTFVATFIGSPSMNLIEGTIRVGDKGTLFIANNGDKLPLGDRKIPDGTKAIYGIRPEHLALSDAERGIATKIILAEPMGNPGAIGAWWCEGGRSVPRADIVCYWGHYLCSA